MKKNILLSIIMYLALFSCKKDNTATINTGDDNKNYAVIFGVSAFTQVVEPAGAKHKKKMLADTSNIKAIANLTYNLYNTDGVKIKTKSYKNTELEFGTIRDSLPQGNYIAVIIGGDYTINNDVATAGIVFYKKVNFTISDSAVSQSVILERMNAGLQVIIKDKPSGNEIPQSYSVTVADYSSFSIFNYQPLSATIVNRYRLVGWQSLADTIDLGTLPSILNTLTPATVTIGAYRNSNGSSTIATKTIGNVMFYRNKKTILRGNLFTNDTIGTGNSGFKILFDNAGLSTDTIKYSF